MSAEPEIREASIPPRAKLGGTYWLLNIIEMFERLGYFSLRVMAPIYIAQVGDKNPGGLNLTQQHKGTIYAWWAILQSGLPIFTGGYADRFGYKRILALSIALNFCGYLMMAYLHSYMGFFAGVLLLATGTAFFKPSLQGSLAQSLDKDNASLGWGVFYWVVNIGSVIAHYIAGPIVGDKSRKGWQRLMLTGAAATLMNVFMLFTFRDVPSGGDKTESLLQVAKRTLVNIWDARLIAWLLIMSCFWLMMYQLWDLQPNFIEDWVDSSMVASYLPQALTEMGDRGLVRVQQQVLISTNSLLIVLLVVPVSWLVRKMRTLSAMLIGMLMATAGVLVAGATPNGWMLLIGIAGFSLGEMLTGPKKQEYLGLIAPPGKTGLYLGYVNIPVGLGVGIGSKLAGSLYGNWGEKASLALKYLMEHTPFGRGRNWDGSMVTLEQATGIERAHAFTQMQQILQIDGVEANRLLWETYAPYRIWYVFVAIGAVAAIALYIFGQLAKRWKDMNA
ncbi:MAG: MFS transporter [Deltaproteobacteria bacterium]|nr:MFS transporter [Deltaproteobacteria bacterium]